MDEAGDSTTTPGGKPLPPLYPLMTKLAGWLREIYSLTETEIRDVILDLRGVSTNFRVSYSAEDNEIITSWNGWVVDWEAGRVRWHQDPVGIDYPLVVSWDWVKNAVGRLRSRQQRERAASQAPPPPEPKARERPRPGGGRLPKYDWTPVKAVLLQKLSDDGAPAAGDGGQARLEEFVKGLFPPDDCPAESVIRNKVRDIVTEFRRSLGIE